MLSTSQRVLDAIKHGEKKTAVKTPNAVNTIWRYSISHRSLYLDLHNHIMLQGSHFPCYLYFHPFPCFAFACKLVCIWMGGEGQWGGGGGGVGWYLHILGVLLLSCAQLSPGAKVYRWLTHSLLVTTRVSYTKEILDRRTPTVYLPVQTV